MTAPTYLVFRRTCRNWEQFAHARKFVQARGLTYEQARQMCEDYNNSRNSTQIRKGTKFEFTNESNFG